MATELKPNKTADPCDVAGIMLIGMKCHGIIDWPWALVLAPLYVPLIMAVAGLLVDLPVFFARSR